MWSGHVGLFAKSNKASSNDRYVDFDNEYCNYPAQISPIPSMVQTIKDVGNKGYAWGPPAPNQWGWNGSLGTWPKKIYKEAFDSGGDNDFGLIMDYVATYTMSGETDGQHFHDLAWPEGYSTGKNIADFWGGNDASGADVNFVDYSGASTRPGSSTITAKPGPKGLEYKPGFPTTYRSYDHDYQGVLSCNKYAPVVGQGLICTSSKQKVADRTGYPVVGNEFSWASAPYDTPSATVILSASGMTGAGTTGYIQFSSGGSITVNHSHLQASATVGHKFGWGYIKSGYGQGSNSWEEGSGNGDDSGNSWKIPGPGRGSQAREVTTEGWGNYGNGRAKFWSCFVGGTVNTLESQGKPISKITFTNGWGRINLSENYDWSAAQSAKSEDIKFRNRLNLQLGEKGLTQGTALIKIVIDFNNVDDDAIWTTARGGQDGLLFTSSGTNCWSDGSLFSNFLIQYRVDENSPWEDALDVNDRKLNVGIWNWAGDKYAGSSVLFFRTPTDEEADGQRRFDATFGGTDGRSGVIKRGVPNSAFRCVEDVNGYGVKRAGSDYFGLPADFRYSSAGNSFTNPTTYYESEGAGMVKVKSDQSKQYTSGNAYTDNDYGDSWATAADTYSGIATKTFNNYSWMPYGMGIMNYTSASPAQASWRAFTEMTFAVNKVGDYRFVFDNLRQGLGTANTVKGDISLNDGDTWNDDATSPSSDQWSAARPLAVALTLGSAISNSPTGTGISSSSTIRHVGPGVSVMVHDLYNQRPEHGHWGLNSPSAPFVAKGDNPNFQYDSNVKDSEYIFYAYTVSKIGKPTRIDAIDFPNDEWTPRIEGTTQYLFAKEPVPRYVKNWYTRSRLNASQPWSYALWRGDLSNDAWYAFTVQPVSKHKNTIPDPSRATAFSFPEEAGVPYGFEQAYGPKIAENGTAPISISGPADDQKHSGIYHTWTFRLEGGGTGKIIADPQPVSYLDIYPNSRPSGMSTLDWEGLPPNQ